MAALALPSLRPRWRQWLSFAPAWGAVLPGALAFPALRSLLDLLPPFLLAVPKKKVSHSRKAMRSANKFLKDKTNIVNCPGCGMPKLAHHLCAHCYGSMTRAWKASKRQADAIPEL